MRVLLTADLQLGAGQGLGVGEYGEGSRFHDQTVMLDRIWEIASEEAVELICVLGDVFDRARPAPHEILAFQAFVRQCVDSGRKVFALLGNHDVRSAALPSALEIFGDNGCVIALAPSLYPIGDLALCALPWTPPSRIVAANPGVSRDELNDQTAQALVNAAHLLATRCEVEHPDKTAVLVGHWAISGAMLPTGLESGMLREPVIPVEGLTSSGFALAAFGHIHVTGVLASGPTPVLYTGSPWTNSWGETDSEHGVWIYDSAGAGSLRFVPVEDPKRFVTLEPSFAETTVFGGEREYTMTLREQAPQLAGALVRVRYTVSEEVAARLDLAAMRQVLLSQGAVKVVFRPTVERSVRARVASASEDLDEVAALELWLSSQDVARPLADELRRAHAGYLERVR